MTGRLLGVCAALVVFAMVSPVAQDDARRVTDPYRDEHFSCDGQPDGRFHNNRSETLCNNGFRIVADLNFDGRPDIILTTRDETSGCGNAGCPVTIYLTQSDNSYASVVGFFLHPLAVASERISPGRGTLVTYWRHSGSEGTLAWDEVTANSLTRTRSVVLHANDSTADQDLYVHWFRGPLALHAEYSRCVSGQLRWSESIR